MAGPLLLATAVGVVLRALHLEIPMRYDEAVTFMAYASMGWEHIATAYETPNNHVLHSLLVWLSTEALGSGSFAIRLPAFLAGCLVPPAAALLALRRHGPATAVVTAALAATAPVLVEYSTNARGYSIVALLTLAAIALADEALERPRAVVWAGLVAVAAAGLYTIPVMLLPWAGVTVWLAGSLVGERRFRDLAAFAGVNVAAGVLVAALYMPMVRANGLEALAGNRFVAALGPVAFLQALPDAALAVAGHWVRGVPAALAVLLAVGVVASVVAAARDRRPGLSMGAAMAVGAILVLLATRNPGQPRVWLWALPLVLMSAAAGWTRLLAAVPRVARGGVVAWSAVVAVAWLLAEGAWIFAARPVHASLETGGFPEGQEVARAIAERMAPGDAVVTDFVSFEPLRYYLVRAGVPPGAILRDPEPAGTAWVVVNHAEADRTAATRRRADALGIPLSEGNPVARIGAADLYGFRSSGG